MKGKINQYLLVFLLVFVSLVFLITAYGIGIRHGIQRGMRLMIDTRACTLSIKAKAINSLKDPVKYEDLARFSELSLNLEGNDLEALIIGEEKIPDNVEEARRSWKGAKERLKNISEGIATPSKDESN